MFKNSLHIHTIKEINNFKQVYILMLTLSAMIFFDKFDLNNQIAKNIFTALHTVQSCKSHSKTVYLSITHDGS